MHCDASASHGKVPGAGRINDGKSIVENVSLPNCIPKGLKWGSLSYV
jgi:hypothetical protein